MTYKILGIIYNAEYEIIGLLVNDKGQIRALIARGNKIEDHQVVILDKEVLKEQ